MNKLAIIESASASNLPTAAWDLVSFFDNAKGYVTIIGGGLVSLLGLIVVIWAAVLIAKKFFGSQQAQQDSWFKVVLMVIVGGALMTGGIVLISEIAKGGETTIKELGGGFIVLQSFQSFFG